MKAGTYQFSSIGLEKLCTKCREFWPADTQFYFPSKSCPTGLHCYCKACYMETRFPERYAA